MNGEPDRTSQSVCLGTGGAVGQPWSALLEQLLSAQFPVLTWWALASVATCISAS